MAETKRLFERLDRSRGLLVSTFHSGFLSISTYFFVMAMPDPYWVTRVARAGDASSNAIVVQDSERAAAFRTLKALTAGKAVLMAPDGRHHGESSAVAMEVLGIRTTVSQGAAVLAYESNCDTGWIGAVRRGNVFVPEYIAGPRRLAGEPYPAFRDRWVAFYAERIEHSLTCEPENLVPTSRWSWPHSSLWR
jgi:lauroyl/myristoyl acyltransferase